MSKKPKEINDFIRSEFLSIPEYTPSRERNSIIRDRVKEKFWIILDKDDILVAIKLLKKNADHLSEDLWNAKKWIHRLGELLWDEDPEVKEKNWEKYLILRIKQTEPHTWESYEEPVAIPMEAIDEIYKDYVHHWMNLSWQEVMDKWWIPGKAWWVLRNRLWLNKNQNIVSDITLKSLSDEDMENKADEMVVEHFFNRHKKILKSAYDKHMKKLLNTYSTNETFLHMFREFLQKYYNPQKPVFPKVKIDNNDIVSIDFGDIHFWKMNTEHILYRLSVLKDSILKMPERIVYLKCFWDITEALSQEWMHYGQMAYWMEQKWWFWFDLLMFAVNTLEQFLMDLEEWWKEVHFTWIPWNHDRLSEDKEKDIKKSWWMIIYEMLKRWLSKCKMEIDYIRQEVTSIDIWNVRYIIAHGDWVFDKQTPEKIIVLYWDTSKYNVIISADKHHFSMKEWISHLWIKTPALAWKWQYDTSMFLWSEPWYLVFKDNQWGTTWFTLNRLPNEKYFNRQ